MFLSRSGLSLIFAFCFFANSIHLQSQSDLLTVTLSGFRILNHAWRNEKSRHKFHNSTQRTYNCPKLRVHAWDRMGNGDYAVNLLEFHHVFLSGRLNQND